MLFPRIFIFIEKSIDEAYAVIYNDYPEGSLTKENADDFLNGMARYQAQKMQADLINEEVIWINNYPGRDIKLKMPNGFTYLIRLYAVKNRFYQIQTVISDDTSAEIAEKVLASFELLEH